MFRGYSGRAKYNNTKTKYKGIVFHSKAECDYYKILLKLQQEEKIKDIQLQVKYPLNNLEGKPRFRYVCDFLVELLNGEKIVIDVKGYLTDVSRVKIAYAQHVYGIKVVLVPTTGSKKLNIDWL